LYPLLKLTETSGKYAGSPLFKMDITK
jgi:hypothetical protein